MSFITFRISLITDFCVFSLPALSKLDETHRARELLRVGEGRRYKARRSNHNSPDGGVSMGEFRKRVNSGTGKKDGELMSKLRVSAV